MRPKRFLLTWLAAVALISIAGLAPSRPRPRRA